MKTEIITDIENSAFQAKREFDASVSLVWRAFTEPSLLDQCGHPNPGNVKPKVWILNQPGNGFTTW